MSTPPVVELPRSSPRGRSRWRTVFFSLVPVLLLLGLLEAGLRLSGLDVQGPDDQTRRFAGFYENAYVWPRDRTLGPWFQVGSDGVVRVNRVLLQRSMHALEFPKDKGPQELRLFALGGSTTQGEPFTDRERGFPERLEKVLTARAPRHRWRVLNTGVGGMDSNAFPDLTREILALNPDGLIIYAGNNELQGHLVQVCMGPVPTEEHRPPGSSLAILRVGRRWLQRLRGDEGYEPEQLIHDQIDCMRGAVRDQREERARSGRGGPDDRVEGDEPWRPVWPDRTDTLYLDTLRQFQRNLEVVLDLARDRDLPVWLAVPTVNAQVPPRFPMFRADLPPRRRDELGHALTVVERLVGEGDLAAAKAANDAVLEEDPTHAGACYNAGMFALAEGDLPRARMLLQAAIDRDFIGTRLTSHLQGVLRGLCRDRPEVRCVDVQAAFEARAGGEPPGNELFVDFCHPTFELGVQMIAETFAEAVLAWEEQLPSGALP